MGRPRKRLVPGQEPLDAFISVKLTKTEKRQLEDFAVKIKLPVTTWIKHLAFRELHTVSNAWTETIPMNKQEGVKT